VGRSKIYEQHSYSSFSKGGDGYSKRRILNQEKSLGLLATPFTKGEWILFPKIATTIFGNFAVFEKITLNRSSL
jgi:hypothetical protein